MLAKEIEENLSEGKHLITKETKGKRGRKLGSLNYRTLQMRERLEALDCDPVEFLASIMKGKAPFGKGMNDAHPMLDSITRFVNEIVDIPVMLPDDRQQQFKDSVKRLAQAAQRLLYDSVPIELRTKSALTLLEYIHAKRKTIEIQDDDGVIEANNEMIAKKYDSLFVSKNEAKLVLKKDITTVE